MNANKQDAGGLPELPEDSLRVSRGSCESVYYTPQQMHEMYHQGWSDALAELCRAAPAGGDVDAQRRLHADIVEWEQRVDAGDISARELWGQVRPSLNALRKLIRDSAPAGGGMATGGYLMDEARERLFKGVGELERTGYIPVGSSDERDARDEQEYDDELCFPEHEVEAMKLEAAQDSAPAGPGEDMAKCLEAIAEVREPLHGWHRGTLHKAAALLRKLQQGAE